MKLFNRMPAEVREAVTPPDRVLTYADGPDGYVIATDRALYIRGPGCRGSGWTGGCGTRRA